MEEDQSVEKKPKPRKIKWFPACLVGLIGLPVIICIAFFAYFSIKSYIHRNFPENYTKPMKFEDAQYICKLLDLPNTDERCRTTPPYSFSFFPEFQKRYIPGMNFQKVEEEIGKFGSCGEWHKSLSDGTLKSCHYDFNGDREYTIYIIFSQGYEGVTESSIIRSVSFPCIKDHYFSLFWNFDCKTDNMR